MAVFVFYHYFTFFSYNIMVILVLFKTNNDFFSKISIFINLNGIYKIIFFNYKKIIEFNEDFIIVDNFIFNGNKLSINKLEDCIVEIFGEIKTIEKKEE